MKNICCLIISVLLSCFLHAQVSYGLKGGLNLSNQVMKVSFGDINISREGKYIPTFHAGAVLDYRFQHNFSIRPELLFTGKGSNFKSEDDNGNESITRLRPYYLELPVTLLYHHDFNHTVEGYAGLGPYLSYGLFGKAKSDQQTEDIFENEGLKRFDAGLYYQAGVKLVNGLFFNAAFAHGFANTANTGSQDQITITMKNKVFMFSIGKFF